ncbi:MAG TPA: carboxylating nicotinate-nucleotide diphosphorylase [Chthonomonadaceae bacterium]|nr:carboxylating nicotinate-nucleotide diphosphorylase [Chthonomonadaceae bacterium]
MPFIALDVEEIVRRALAEDIGTGDVTTLLTVPEEAQARAVMWAKAEGIVAGLPVVAEVYRQVDPTLTVEFAVADGSRVLSGDAICVIAGSAQSILTGERVALNFVQRLSGIATKTARFVDLVAGMRARIVDTRKTTPGLRSLEKYAVRVGGGHNHRFGLYDAILIKDNHIQASGGITAAVQRALAQAPHTMTVTVECETLEQAQEALAAGADILLLDNMSPEQLAEAVAQVGGQVTIEASGGVTEETVAAIAQAGVDIISVGALTHSAVALDISLDLETLTSRPTP